MLDPENNCSGRFPRTPGGFSEGLERSRDAQETLEQPPSFLSNDFLSNPGLALKRWLKLSRTSGLSHIFSACDHEPSEKVYYT